MHSRQTVGACLFFFIILFKGHLVIVTCGYLIQQYALQQAFKTMMGQAAPENGRNATFPQGSPFPFPPTPPPISSTTSPSFSSIPSPAHIASQSAVTVDVSSTKVEVTPLAKVDDELEIKKEEKKYGILLSSRLQHSFYS